jgi:hypothetical protein
MSSTQVSCLESRGCYFSQLLIEALHLQILSTTSFGRRLDFPPNCTYRNWREALIPCKISTNSFAQHALTSSWCLYTKPRRQIWVWGLRSWYVTPSVVNSVTLILFKVVDKESAVLGYPNENSSALNADHHSMSKFRDTEDANYVHVRNILRMFLKAIKTPGKLRPASGP